MKTFLLPRQLTLSISDLNLWPKYIVVRRLHWNSMDCIYIVSHQPLKALHSRSRIYAFVHTCNLGYSVLSEVTLRVQTRDQTTNPGTKLTIDPENKVTHFEVWRIYQEHLTSQKGNCADIL